MMDYQKMRDALMAFEIKEYWVELPDDATIDRSRHYMRSENGRLMIQKIPKRLIEQDLATLHGAEILRFRQVAANDYVHKGGGGGCADLLLKRRDGVIESLTIAIPIPTWHMLLDDRWIEARYELYKIQKPLIWHEITPPYPSGDELRPQLIGGIIENILVAEGSLRINYRKNGMTHVFEVLDIDDRLPGYPDGPSGTYKEPIKGIHKKVIPVGRKIGDYLYLIEEGGHIYTCEGIEHNKR